MAPRSSIALADDGRELARRRVSTPRGDYRGTVDAIAALVVAIEADTGGRGTVGVGIPGALSRLTGLVKNANSTCLIGRPLGADLEAAHGQKNDWETQCATCHTTRWITRR